VFLRCNAFRISHGSFQLIIWSHFKNLTINDGTAAGSPTRTPGLHSQNAPCFAWQPSARVSQTLRPSYNSHVTAAATLADQYWYPHRSDCRNTLIYAHTNSRTLMLCDIGLGSLTVTTPEAGDFVKFILVYMYQVLITWCWKIKCRAFNENTLEKRLGQFSWKPEWFVGAWSGDVQTQRSYVCLRDYTTICSKRESRLEIYGHAS